MGTNELQRGDSFGDDQCLSNAWAKVMLMRVKEEEKEEDKEEDKKEDRSHGLSVCPFDVLSPHCSPLGPLCTVNCTTHYTLCTVYCAAPRWDHLAL